MSALATYFDGLDPAQLATLARRYQTLARADGVYVTLADGAEIAIPPILTPVLVTEAQRLSLARTARLLVSATDRVARALLRGPDSAQKERVLSSLSPFERAALVTPHAMTLATARVDFLVDASGAARALEINSTIPAMQGYSDAIAAAFLRAVGEQRQLDERVIATAIDRNGRNTDDLLASLLALHAARGGNVTKQRIAIVARPGDSQGGELDHYVRRWCALGHDAFRCTPDRVEPGGRVDGRAVDVFYRHVFLRRLEAGGAFATMLVDGSAHVWNPPASHLELKAMLGLVSVAAMEKSVLDDDEREVVACLPWTRVCAPGPSTDPEGSPIGELLDFIIAHPDRLVLKRSWDYGGRGVFLGAELAEESSQVKLNALLGPRDRPWTWGELVAWVTQDREAWVVQTLVDVQPESRLRIDDAGVKSHPLYADISAFTSLGNAVEPTGGAVRASTGRIVNIQGGGGLVPLLCDDALALLFE